MSIMRRMRDMTMATFNEMLDKVEDPLKWIEKYLEEKTKLLRQMEGLYQQSLSHMQSLKKQSRFAEEMMLKREQQALLALQAEEEDLARIALSEKITYEEKYTNYHLLYEQAENQVFILQEQLQELRADLQEVLEKRQYYQDRLKMVSIQQKLNEHLGITGGLQRVSRLERLEEKVSALEYETDAIRQLRYQSARTVQTLARAVDEKIEKELLRLKSKAK